MSERNFMVAKNSEIDTGTKAVRQQCRPSGERPLNTVADHIIFLQRTAGNQAVERLCRSGAIQAKLEVGRPNDIYEQEADRVAEQVMRMPDSAIQQSSISVAPLIQRDVDEDEEEVIQPKRICGGVPRVTPDMEASINYLKGRGEPLDAETRTFFEARFGHDFSQVRVHACSKAAEFARAIHAEALTFGGDIVFGAGKFEPHTTRGKKLFAHELTHVIQQNKAINGNFTQQTDSTSGKLPSITTVDSKHHNNIKSFIQRSQVNYYAPDVDQLRTLLNEMKDNTDTLGVEFGVKQPFGTTQLDMLGGNNAQLPPRGSSSVLAHSHIPGYDPTSAPSICHDADMDILRDQVREFKSGGPREHAIYSPNGRSYLRFSKTGNSAKVVTFKPDGKVLVGRLNYVPDPAKNHLAAATKWRSSGMKEMSRAGAAFERTKAVATSPLGEFAAQSGAGKGTAILSMARHGAEMGVKGALGGLAVLGAASGGVQVGGGINKIVEGKTAEGVIDTSEGAANLGLSIGTPIAIKSGTLVAEGGIAAGGLALAAGAAASGSVILLAETARAASKGEKTPIDVADKFYGTHFGDIYGWITGVYSKK